MSCPFASLPQELLYIIASFATHQSILRLRQTSHRFAQLCDFPLQDRCRRLYLHPETIHYATDLLSSSTKDSSAASRWTQDISQIIILGRNTLDVFQTGSDIISTDAEFCYLHPWTRLCISPVPASIDRDGELQVGNADAPRIEDDFANLWKGLRNLPNLRIVSYATSKNTFGEGFCSVSDNTVQMYSEKGDGRSTDCEWNRLSSRTREHRWCDAEMLFAAMKTLQDVVDHIELFECVPVAGTLCLFDRVWSYSSWHSVTRLQLTLPTSINGDLSDFWHFLKKVANRLSQLKTLEIDYDGPVDSMVKNLEREYCFGRWEDQFFESDSKFNKWGLCRSAPLTKLIVRGKTKFPFLVQAEVLWRLIACYSETLKHIEICNIVPTSTNARDSGLPHLSPDAIVKGVDEVVDLIGLDRQNLEVAIMTIPKVDPANMMQGQDMDINSSNSRLLKELMEPNRLENLASHMGIELVNGCWDFAAHVVD